MDGECVNVCCDRVVIYVSHDNTSRFECINDCVDHRVLLCQVRLTKPNLVSTHSCETITLPNQSATREHEFDASVWWRVNTVPKARDLPSDTMGDPIGEVVGLACHHVDTIVTEPHLDPTRTRRTIMFLAQFVVK